MGGFQPGVLGNKGGMEFGVGENLGAPTVSPGAGWPEGSGHGRRGSDCQSPCVATLCSSRWGHSPLQALRKAPRLPLAERSLCPHEFTGSQV